MGALPTAPICVGCRCFYFPKKNGFAVLEGMPDKKPAHLFPEDIRGNRMPEAWSPYKLWLADLWECKDCGKQIVKGMPNSPLSEHYKPDFKAWVERYGGDNIFKVFDC